MLTFSNMRCGIHNGVYGYLWSAIGVFAIIIAILLIQQSILKDEEPKLNQFIYTCLRNKTDADQIINRLDQEGIDIVTLFQLEQEDIRAMFNEFGIKSLHTGLIISKLLDSKRSTDKYRECPSRRLQLSVVVVPTNQNEYILSLNQNLENVHETIKKIEEAEKDFNDTVTDVTLQIDQFYKQLIVILNDQKNVALRKLDGIKTRKLELLNSQKNNATQALTFLQNSTDYLVDIMNDMTLDISTKQYSITALIKTSQQSLLDYQEHLGPLHVTKTNIIYEAKDSQSFEECLMNMDNLKVC